MSKFIIFLRSGLKRALLVLFASFSLSIILGKQILFQNNKPIALRAGLFFLLVLIIDLLLEYAIFCIIQSFDSSNKNRISNIHKLLLNSRRIFAKIFIYGIFALALLSPFASNDKLPLAGDLPVHFSLIVQAGSAIQEGQFPLRVAPGLYYGWRYPEFQFYSQFPYIMGGYLFRHFFPQNPLIVLKLLIWFSLFISGIGMSLLAEKFSKNKIASLLAGTIYIVSPYFLINIFSRGAFPEVIAQGVLPLVILTTYNLYESKNIKYYFPAVILWFIFSTTHNITFIYSAIFIGIYFLFRAILDNKLTSLLRLGLVVVFSCLMASYFLGPILKADYLLIRAEDFPTYAFSWYTHISTLLSPVSIAPEPSKIHPTVIGLNPAIGWPIIFCTLFFISSLFSTREESDKSTQPDRNSPILLFLLLLFSFILAWSPMDFWSGLPKVLRMMQFNYRFLTQVMWTGSILASISLVKLFGEGMDNRHLFIGLFIIGFSSTSFLISREPSPQTMQELVKIQGINITNDYLFDQSRLPGQVYSGINLPLLTYENNLVTGKSIYLGNVNLNQGNIKLLLKADNIGAAAVKLFLKVNDHIISERLVEKGEFNWTIPISVLNSNSSANTLEFSAIPVDEITETRIHVKSLEIQGLPPELTVATIKSVTGNTSQTGEVTNSRVNVKNDAQIIQLPVLYLPDVTQVKVNGEQSDYFPVPNGQFTMVGLKLQPGNYQIETKFVGMDWANTISIGAWLILFVAFFAYTVRRQIKNHK